MKRQIRRSVFETNSSSTHSLCICTEDDYNKWINGQMVYDSYSEQLVDVTSENKKEDYRFQTYDNYGSCYFEAYTEHFTTPSGDKMVAFGEYGYDG